MTLILNSASISQILEPSLQGVISSFGYLSWKITILKYTGKYTEEALRAMKQASREAGWFCIMYKNLFSLILLGA